MGNAQGVEWWFSMPTFKKKPEIVDARQFRGDRVDGLDIVLWITSNDGQAVWTEPDDIRPAKVFVEEERFKFIPAFKNDWIVFHQNGSFEVVRPELFADTYEQV